MGKANEVLGYLKYPFPYLPSGCYGINRNVVINGEPEYLEYN